jgi:hypothetical protein
VYLENRIESKFAEKKKHQSNEKEAEVMVTL